MKHKNEHNRLIIGAMPKSIMSKFWSIIDSSLAVAQSMHRLFKSYRLAIYLISIMTSKYKPWLQNKTKPHLLDPYFARSTEGTIHGVRNKSILCFTKYLSLLCAGQSTGCANPYFAHNICTMWALYGLASPTLVSSIHNHNESLPETFVIQKYENRRGSKKLLEADTSRPRARKKYPPTWHWCGTSVRDEIPYWQGFALCSIGTCNVEWHLWVALFVYILVEKDTVYA